MFSTTTSPLSDDRYNVNISIKNSQNQGHYSTLASYKHVNKNRAKSRDMQRQTMIMSHFGSGFTSKDKNSQ